MPKIIRALSADAHLVVSLLRRETVRSCGGVNGAELPMLCQRSGEKIGTGCAIVIPSHATLSQLPSGQGIRPDPPVRSAGKKNRLVRAVNKKVVCANNQDDVSESNFAASRPEKQFTPDVLRRSLAR